MLFTDNFFNNYFWTCSFYLFLYKSGSILASTCLVHSSYFSISLEEIWRGSLWINHSNSQSWWLRIFDEIPHLKMKSLKKYSRAILLFSFLVGWACVNPEEWSVTSASTHTLPYLNMNGELLNKPVTWVPKSSWTGTVLFSSSIFSRTQGFAGVTVFSFCV